MDKSFSSWDSPEGDILHPGDCIQQLLEQVRRHKVNINGNVCAVMVTTLVLEVISVFFLCPLLYHSHFFHPLKVADIYMVTQCAYQFIFD